MGADRAYAGPADLSFKGTDFTEVLGAVEVSITDERGADVQFAGTGKTVRRRHHVGDNISVKATVGVMDPALFSLVGSPSGTLAANVWTVTGVPQGPLSGGALIVTPKNTSAFRHIKLFKATPEITGTIRADNEEVMGYEVTWTGEYDEGVSKLYEIDFSASDTTPPTVSNVSPADTATGITVSDNIELTFSEDVLEASALDAGNSTLIDTTDGSVVAVTRSYDSATKKLTLNPNANLSALTKYSVLVQDVMDLGLNKMAAPFTSTFTTA